MASPKLNLKTYRICNLPRHLTLPSFKEILMQNGLGPIQHASLCRYNAGPNPFCTGTVTIKTDDQKPAAQSMPTRICHNGDEFVLDSEMRGFTPLSDGVDNKETVKCVPLGFCHAGKLPG